LHKCTFATPEKKYGESHSGAHALGYGIHTQGDTLDELRTMVKDAVACYFDDPAVAPKISVTAEHR
jgi:ABC-type Zn2+ transport system substrate-binding protein/surface adhesin